MKLLDLTLPTPEENLAYDEELLALGEAREGGEVLRFWTSQNYFVVLGYSNKPDEEVHTGFCQKNQITVLRRISGGGTVLQGPGCLNYSLVLDLKKRAQLHSVTSTNRFVMEKHARALTLLLKQPVEVKGHTDLALGGLKFSGNAQRRKRDFVLFHGTFLLAFDLALIEKTLKFPSKQPAYRQHRPHKGFLMNLGVSETSVSQCLKNAWSSQGGI